MKKRLVFLNVLGILILLSFCVTSTNAMTTLVTDPQNDVVKYQTDPTSGTTGAFHPEIDIKALSTNNTDLILECYATPTLAANCWYNIYVNNDSDSDFEFSLVTGVSNARLSTFMSNAYWDNALGQWVTSYTYLPYTIVNNSIIFEGVVAAIPTINASSYIAINNMLSEAPWSYQDTAHYGEIQNQVPGFSVILICFGLITLIGIILVLRKPKVC